MKIREKRRLTQNKGVSVKIRETWQVWYYYKLIINALEKRDAEENNPFSKVNAPSKKRKIEAP